MPENKALYFKEKPGKRVIKTLKVDKSIKHLNVFLTLQR